MSALVNVTRARTPATRGASAASCSAWSSGLGGGAAGSPPSAAWAIPPLMASAATAPARARRRREEMVRSRRMGRCLPGEMVTVVRAGLERSLRGVRPSAGPRARRVARGARTATPLTTASAALTPAPRRGPAAPDGRLGLDHALAAVAGQERPRPARDRHEPVAPADEEADVDERPDEERERAREAHPEGDADGAAAPDHGERAAVVVAEPALGRAAGEPAPDRVPGVPALLHRGGGDRRARGRARPCRRSPAPPGGRGA